MPEEDTSAQVAQPSSMRRVHLAHDWKRIIKRAKSFHLGVLAFVFEGAGIVLPIYTDKFQRNTFAILVLVALAGALYFRVTRQKGYYK